MSLTLNKLGAEIVVPTDYTISRATVKPPYEKQDSRFETAIEQEIIFDSLPQRFDFPIPLTVKDVTFYRQPSLLEELNPKDWDVLTETEAWKNGKLYVHRPIEYCESLAGYHAYKWGNEAKAGKILQSPRPKLIDKLGAVGWGKMDYLNGNLIVTLPQEWMKAAQFPVTVDPTFGYTSVGGTERNPWIENTKIACKFGATANGTATALHWYGCVNSGSGSIYGIDYTDNAGAPDALIDYSDAVTVDTTEQWWDFTSNFSAAITNGNDYWLGINQAGTTPHYWYDAGAANQLIEGSDWGDAPPPSDPFGTGGASYFAYKMSVYVDYTAAGGVTVPVMANQLTTNIAHKVKGG